MQKYANVVPAVNQVSVFFLLVIKFKKAGFCKSYEVWNFLIVLLSIGMSFCFRWSFTLTSTKKTCWTTLYKKAPRFKRIPPLEQERYAPALDLICVSHLWFNNRKNYELPNELNIYLRTILVLQRCCFPNPLKCKK